MVEVAERSGEVARLVELGPVVDELLRIVRFEGASRRRGSRRRGSGRRRTSSPRRAFARDEVGDDPGAERDEEERASGDERRRHALGAVERSPELDGIPEAPRGFLREGLLDDRREPDRDVGSRPAERRERPRPDVLQDLLDLLAPERALAGEALVEDRSEREDVGRGLDGPRIRELLGRHVTRGAAGGAGPRERDGPARARGFTVEVLREAEVRHEGGALGGEQHVLRLHVAVDDAALVSAPEGLGEGASERDRLLEAEPAARESLAKRSSREERHDEVRSAVDRPRVEERHEAVASGEEPEEPALSLEAREPVSVDPQEELERDLVAPRRARPEHGSGAASSELREDVVAAELHGATRARRRASSSPSSTEPPCPGTRATPRRARGNARPRRPDARRPSRGASP